MLCPVDSYRLLVCFIIDLNKSILVVLELVFQSGNKLCAVEPFVCLSFVFLCPAGLIFNISAPEYPGFVDDLGIGKAFKHIPLACTIIYVPVISHSGIILVAVLVSPFHAVPINRVVPAVYRIVYRPVYLSIDINIIVAAFLFKLFKH